MTSNIRSMAPLNHKSLPPHGPVRDLLVEAAVTDDVGSFSQLPTTRANQIESTNGFMSRLDQNSQLDLSS